MHVVSLPQLFEKLKRSPRVQGIFTTGSTAGQLAPWSDIDIVVLLDANPEGIRSVYAMVENHFADVFFFDTAFVRTLRKAGRVPANDWAGMFTTWLSTGRIEYDPDQTLRELQQHFKKTQPTQIVTEQEQRDLWGKINYNFIANNRYFSAEDERYHQALELRLLYSVIELVTAYCAFRNLPWRGEKAALETFATTDQKYAELLQNYHRQHELDKKMLIYRELFDHALFGPFQQWPKDFLVSMSNDGHYAESAKVFWDQLLEQK